MLNLKVNTRFIPPMKIRKISLLANEKRMFLHIIFVHVLTFCSPQLYAFFCNSTLRGQSTMRSFVAVEVLKMLATIKHHKYSTKNV